MAKLLLLCIVFSLQFKAQDNPTNIFTLKPALGLNACQIHGDNYSGFDKVGVFIGTAINAKINKKASLELGFYFSQKGSRHNPNPKTGDNRSYVLNLYYIDLPLSFRYMVNPRYFITLGPSFAYLFGHKEVIDYTDMTSYYHFNNYEAGLNIGLGRKIKDKFCVEVRSSNSISAIRNYGMASTVFYPNAVARFFNKGFYNNIITLFVSYTIDLKRKNAN